MTVSDPDVPLLTGTLTDRPFPRLLFFLLRRNITGLLCIMDDSGDKSIVFFRNGRPVYADRPNELDRLDKIFAETGAVSAQQLAEAEATRAESGRRLGDVVQAMGLLPREKVADLLRLQLRRKLSRLFFQQRARFEIFVDDHFFGVGDDFEVMRVDPLGLVYPGIRAAYDDNRLDRELGSVNGRVLKLMPAAESEVGQMGFLPSDDRVLAALRDKGVRGEDLSMHGPKTADGRAVGLALLYAEMLEVRAPGPTGIGVPQAPAAGASTGGAAPGSARGREEPGVAQGAVRVQAPASGVRSAAASASAPPAPGARPRTGTPVVGVPVKPAAGKPAVGKAAVPDRGAAARPGAKPAAPTRPTSAPAAKPAAPPPPKISEAELRKQILDFGSRAEKMSFYEVLGIAQEATAEEVTQAYLKQVKQFHPDRVHSLGIQDLKVEVERIMARVSEANVVLTDPKKREDYTRALKFGDVDRMRVMNAVEAELSFQKGDAFLKKGDFAKAEQAFADSVRQNQDEPEHRALLAWSKFMNGGIEKAKRATEAITILRDMVQLRPKFARGHVFLAELWKYKNDLGRAEQAYRDAIEADPYNVDAQRELRLLEMRGTKGGGGGKGGGEKKGGFFDKLRKR